MFRYETEPKLLRIISHKNTYLPVRYVRYEKNKIERGENDKTSNLSKFGPTRSFLHLMKVLVQMSKISSLN